MTVTPAGWNPYAADYARYLAFLSLGFAVPLRWARAAVALAFGVIGFLIAVLALRDAAATYEAGSTTGPTATGLA